jgi:hypothetical protein
MEPQYAKKYIAEFARMLKPGGVLMFQEPSELKPEWKLRFKNFNRGFRGSVKRLLPKTWLNFYRKVRSQLFNLPIMEVYGIEKAEVDDLLNQLGFRIIEAKEFGDAGPEWVSYRYVAVK